jgi:SAM-dependent methyltransferase
MAGVGNEATPRSTSSLSLSSLQDSSRELFGILKMHWARKHGEAEFAWVFANVSEYGALLWEHCGLDLRDAKVLEVGYGARPIRMMTLHSIGVDAYGIDMDRPSLGGSPAEIVRILRSNGWRRALKTIVRSVLFDAAERRGLAAVLRARGYQFRLRPDRFLVGDAGGPELAGSFEREAFDLIISEDVFEHIPPGSLQGVVRNIARLLRPGGIALIRPLLFTGPSGSHLLEWYPHRIPVREAKRSEPWEQLRKRRFVANTYLNELRWSDYRDLFTPHFTVLEERFAHAAEAAQWMTPELRQQLASYGTDELLTNHVLFVLKRRLRRASTVI